VKFNGQSARILLDQMRSVDKRRLLGKMGVIEDHLWHPGLLEMFA
jgi:mRNA interferase MazF